MTLALLESTARAVPAAFRLLCAVALTALCLSRSSAADISARTNTPEIKAAQAAVPAGVPPLPEPAKSPVDYFRELLAMSPAERNAALASRTPESRNLILAKLREYQSLRPEQRELRLKATELRWYLLPLMRSPGTNRTAQLSAIPAESRPLIQERIERWDKLPADLQKQLLENEAAINLMLSSPPEPPNARPTPAQQALQARQRAGMQRLESLSEDERQNVIRQFKEFFDLTAREKQKTLGTLSSAEQRQIERSLKAYESLPLSKRNQCMRSFEKFAGLSPEEREQFLSNAKKWQTMTLSERQAWRDLIERFRLPPLPPEPPPLPPTIPSPRPGGAAVATTNHP